MQISCIIPTRNRCRMVCEAIESVQGQTVFVPEIIVVDDGSEDDTAAVVADHYPMIDFIRLNGLGAGPARNAGAKAASGDILMFLDSDDLWLAGHVEELVKVLARGFKVAYGITETMDSIGNRLFQIPAEDEQQEENCFHSLLHWCFLVPSAVAVGRNEFFQSGGFNNEKFEDWSFFLRLADRYSFGFANHLVSRRRLHAGSLSVRADREEIAAGLDEIYRLLPHCQNTSEKDMDRFAMIIDWVRQQDSKWHTLQDWYTAMKQEGFI